MKKIKFIGATRNEKIFGLVAVFLALLLFARNSITMPGLSEWRNVRERIVVQRELYDRHLAVYSQREVVEDIYNKNIKTIEDIEKKIFSGKNINVAAAKMQKVVQRLATENNMSTKRTNTEKPVEISDGLFVITLGLFGSAHSMADLNSFLEQIEYAKDKLIYIPRIYLKNVRKEIVFEMQAFSIAMIG